MYQPSQKTLEKYANILVNFALGSGKGIKKNDVVRISVPEIAKPILIELYKAVLRAGGNPMIHYLPSDDEQSNMSKTYYDLASTDQLKFFANKYYKGMVNQVDHTISIIAETDKFALKDVDPTKIMIKNKVSKPVSDWMFEKENKGNLTWVAALYGTQACAKEAKLTLEEYWQQIIKGCFLDEENPIKKWQEVSESIKNIIDKLNKLKIEKVHIEGENVNLWIKIGEKRKWNGGGGRNIPSFEIFISPDWHGTNGFIKFDQPLYRYGNLITGIELEFKNGVVVKSKANHNEKILKEMIKVKGANKIGEFSLTDSRFSHITKFMAETLFDENVGGREGNTHIALGMSYKDCFDGNPEKVSKKEWNRLGYNDSAIHADIVSTEKRKVTAVLENGKEMVIYEDGKFVI